MQDNAPLAKLQRWLLTAITDPIAPPPTDAEQVLSPSRNQSSSDRLGVYRDAYIARLLEVLRDQFPCLRFAVGDQLFDRFAIGYLRTYPPRSYTLARLADQLVDYLDDSRPADWGHFIVELARLEQTIDHVFDAVGPEKLPPFTMPQDANESLVLHLAPGLALLSFRYPASSFYTDWKAGRQPPWPKPRDQYVAILRRDYIVRRHELKALQYELLRAISRGMKLAQAIDSVSAAADELIGDDFADQIRVAFSTLAANGVFVSAI